MMRQSYFRTLGMLLLMVATAVSSEVPMDDGSINPERTIKFLPGGLLPDFSGKIVKREIELSPETVEALQKAKDMFQDNNFNWDTPLKTFGNSDENPTATDYRKRKNRKSSRKNKKPKDTLEDGDDFTSVMNGIKGLGKVINDGREFFKNNQKFDIRKERVPYHSGLAAQYGTLTSQSIKAMDKNLKAVIAGTNRLMKRLQGKVDNIGAEIPFDDYLAVMNQNVMLQVKEDSKVVNSSVLGFEGYNWFKFDGSPEKKKIYKVLSWFTNLINDQDVLKDTKIDIEDFANIIAATGAAVSDFATFFYAKEYIERSIVDVGVLRYPDPVHPFFKLYRIQLFAYRKSTRVLATQKDEAGIKGDFESVHFIPRDEVLNQMKDEVMKKAVSEAEAMFSF